MRTRSYRLGEVFLLFQKLPYDFHSGKLPIKILDDLYFDDTPVELLDSRSLYSEGDDVNRLLEHACLVNIVLPYHNLPGTGVNHCCLRRETLRTSQYHDLPASSLFAHFITALRLQKPCAIVGGGQFEVGSDDEPIKKPAPWSRTTVHNPGDAGRYSKADIEVSSNITKDLLEIRQSNNESHIESALIYFSQVTQGFSVSLQLSYLGLWAALEALFQPTGTNKAETIARRITAYLSGFLANDEDMKSWLKTEYRKRRSEFIHGSHIAPPDLQNVRKGKVAFRKLHEVTRLCLLGFLSMEKSERRQVFQKKGMQKKLDSLACAEGKYLNKQRMYLPD
jgi:hypothetical protein